MTRYSLPLVLILVTLPTLVGCGARKEYGADHLDIRRNGWDTLQVEVDFVRRTVLGGGVPIRPDTVTVEIFDEGYETVYAGVPGRITLPDGSLGNRERLTVETCGVVNRHQICMQDLVYASPKRLSIDEDIAYPAGSDLAEGSYEFAFRAERQVYGGDTWEPIEPGEVQGELLAWVENDEARREGAVRIPFTASRGRFDLSRYPNYKNFRYYLDSELLDEASAAVHFEIYAGLGPHRNLLTAVRKQVDPKTDGDRADDVRFFVEQATERLIDELGSFLGGRGASAFVRRWEYHRVSRTYEVSMEAEWEGSVFNRRTHEIAGVLEVREDGSAATFRMRNGNRRAVDRWRDRADGDVLRLGTLDVRRAPSSASIF